MTSQTIDPSAVRAALANFEDPEPGKSIVETGQLSEIEVKSDEISLTLALSTHSAILRDEVHSRLTTLVAERFPSAKRVNVRLADFQRPAPKIGQIGLSAK